MKGWARISLVEDNPDNPDDAAMTREASAECNFENETEVVRDGQEVLPRITRDEKRKDIPVLIMTSPREEEVAKGYPSGVNARVDKSVEFSRLVDSVQGPGVILAITNQLLIGSVSRSL